MRVSENTCFITGTDLPVDGGYGSIGPEGLGQTAIVAGSRRGDDLAAGLAPRIEPIARFACSKVFAGAGHRYCSKTSAKTDR